MHPTLYVPLGYRKDGRPIFPIRGAQDAPPVEDPPVEPPKPPAPADPPPKPDKGFPEGTPLAEMSAEQQVAYWKDEARKHEDTVKSLGNIDDLKARAAQFDALAEASKTEHERAIEEARSAGLAEGYASSLPDLFAAKFEAAAAGRLTDERIAEMLPALNVDHFLNDEGVIDTAKVRSYVDGIAPATGNQQRGGPSPHGQGNRPSSATPSAASGRALYAQLHPKKAS